MTPTPTHTFRRLIDTGEATVLVRRSPMTVTRTILVNKSRRAILRAAKEGLKNAPNRTRVKISDYTRAPWGTLPVRYRKLECWLAIDRLCSLCDRHKINAEDRRMARDAIALLQDTFDV